VLNLDVTTNKGFYKSLDFEYYEKKESERVFAGKCLIIDHPRSINYHLSGEMPRG